jgi:hypothetical protein
VNRVAVRIREIRSPLSPGLVYWRSKLGCPECAQSRAGLVHVVDVEEELERSCPRGDRPPVHVLAVCGSEADAGRFKLR